MTYQFLSGFHIGAAISALVFGLCVFLTRKGTRLHKQFGYAYFFNMLGLPICVSRLRLLAGCIRRYCDSFRNRRSPDRAGAWKIHFRTIGVSKKNCCTVEYSGCAPATRRDVPLRKTGGLIVHLFFVRRLYQAAFKNFTTCSWMDLDCSAPL
jgi:hypothetical protein